MRFFKSFFCGLVLSVWGCGTEVSEEVVASVGMRKISVDDFTAGARKMYGKDNSVERLSSDEKRKVLDALIAAELLALEGLERGLDQEPAIREELDALERKLLVKEFNERDLWVGLEITEEEVQTRYEAWGFGEQVHLAHILCRGKEKAEEILAELARGGDFAELARQRSRHAESAQVGGDMGYLRKGSVLPEVSAVVWEMPEGRIYPRPIRTRMGHHIVKVMGRRRQSLDEQRFALERRLEREKKTEKERIFWIQLQQRYDLQWEPEIAALMAQRKELPDEQVLFRWKGGQLNAADYVRRANVPQPVFRDTARIRRLAEGLVMKELIYLEALQQGYDKLESVRWSIDKKRGELMASRLFELEFAGGDIPARQLRDFYERNRERYRDYTRITIREILVDDRPLADSLHALIQNGADMSELVRRYTRRSALRDGDGIWEDVEPRDPRSAKIYRAALEGEGLLQPVKVMGGFSVIHVLEKRQGRLLELAEVEKSLREDVATAEMDAFIDRLRRLYDNEIKINEMW